MYLLYPYRDRGAAPPVTHCHQCGREQYRNDTVYLDGAFILCETCGETRPFAVSMTGEELQEYFGEIYGGRYD